ncbi:hypothetical protein F5Y19DRAFT_306261 [Xylariaceae sp. FL1651]|nr:hypothetical protein F5Y19DRAFT_306261 [Xylariaceae sp. FL1651]
MVWRRILSTVVGCGSQDGDWTDAVSTHADTQASMQRFSCNTRASPPSASPALVRAPKVRRVASTAAGESAGACFLTDEPSSRVKRKVKALSKGAHSTSADGLDKKVYRRKAAAAAAAAAVAAASSGHRFSGKRQVPLISQIHVKNVDEGMSVIIRFNI